MNAMNRSFLTTAGISAFLTVACTVSNPIEREPLPPMTPEPKTPIPPAAAIITRELIDLLTLPPTPTKIVIATPTLRPIEAVPSPYAVATRALDDARDLVDAKNNVIATLNGNRNLLSYTEGGPLTETQLKALMEKNNIGLAFKKGINGNPDKLSVMGKGELKEIPVPQLTPRLTPDDFWSDQDNPENPHALMTEKAGTKTHVVFNGKDWVENVDGKSTGRVVFDMQKETAAIGGPIPGAIETVVTVTPKPPTPEVVKPVLGTVEINGAKVDLDRALEAMQDKNNLPAWRDIDLTVTLTNKWEPASILRLDRNPVELNPIAWQYGLRNTDDKQLLGTLYAGGEIPLYLIRQVDVNSWVAIPTGKSFGYKNLKDVSSKNVVILGLKQEDATVIRRMGLKGVGILNLK